MHAENNELKKSIKYTRMTELQEENREIQEELTRLQRKVTENGRVKEEMLGVFAQEKQEFRLSQRKELAAKRKLAKELK